jgi:FkbM family methyltransferase
MRGVFFVTSLAVSLLLVVVGSGCKEEVPTPSAVGEPVAVEESAAESVAAEATKPARQDIVNTAKKLYSQFDEEIVIRDFFQDRRDGFFLDVGCAFPRRNSTTFYLDKHLGWTGIGVDAVAEYSEPWASHRPGTKFLNLLISDHSDTEDTFYRAAWWEVSSAKKEMVEKPGGRDEPYEYTEIKVRTITIDKLLEDNGVEKLDFMSMDIEGFQMTALAAFDIQKYQPELVCIEAYRPDRPKINAWFEERGYKRIDRYLKHDYINWYYTPADNPALLIE